MLKPEDDNASTKGPKTDQRRTVVEGLRRDCIIEVVGGDEALHRANVELAERIVLLPKRDFEKNARRLLAVQI